MAQGYFEMCQNSTLFLGNGRNRGGGETGDPKGRVPIAAGALPTIDDVRSLCGTPAPQSFTVSIVREISVGSRSRFGYDSGGPI